MRRESPVTLGVTTMSIFSRSLRRLLALLAPTAFSVPASGAPIASETAQAPAFSILAKRLNEEPGMRARFAREPRAVLREVGMDPDSLDVGESLSDAGIDRFIERWRTAEAAVRPQKPEDGPPRQSSPQPLPPLRSVSPPAVIYGPPPGLQPPRPVPPQSREPPPPPPQAPVYGPPPGIR